MILCLLCGSLPMASAAGSIVIDGTWSVLLPEAPTAYEAYAAETLRRSRTIGAPKAAEKERPSKASYSDYAVERRL